MRYKKAFKCDKCPERLDENGCPAWWEMIFSNDRGEDKLVKECAWSLLPKLMIEVIKASNRPAAAVESCRNEIASGFRNVGDIMKMLPALMDNKLDFKEITNDS